MITIVVIKNPFKPHEREIQSVSHSHVMTLSGYLKDIIDDSDFAVSINGKIIPRDEWRYTGVADGSYVAVVPVLHGGGDDKNPFAIIAGIALMAWTGGLAKGGLFGFSGGSFGAQLAAGVITMVGGMIINRLFPPPKPDIPEASSANPTYTWGKMQSLQTQGNALGTTYGTVGSAGQVIGQHVTSDGDKQYLSILMLAGEGPIDAITNILINDNPAENYENVTVDIRYGTNNQTVIPNFNDTFADQQLNFEIDFAYSGSGQWSTQVTDSGSAQGLEVELTLPGGLYHVKDDGGLEETYVQFEISYRPVTSSSWIPFGGNGVYLINASQNNAVRRTYRIDNLASGKYEVRIRGLGRMGQNEDGSISTRYLNRLYWTQLSSIIYDDFSYPGKALIGIRALATDQLSGGVPSVTWVQTRNSVWVYNPSTARYESKAANNPAWACYDIIHRARKIRNIITNTDEVTVFGIPASRLNYSRFAAWADFCTEKQLEFNFIFDSASDMWAAMKKPETVGRGRIVLQGTTYSCVFDAPAQPVQMFTMGNIVAGTFKEHFLSLKDRANAIEITYVDKDRGYQRTAVTVYGDDYNESEGIINNSQITLEGVTSIAAAYKHGKYLLRCNRYLTRTAEWEADVDSIACQVGDIVLLQHDVPQWGYGGRIVSATTTSVTLDKDVVMLPGKIYGLLVRFANDTIVERTVESVSVETTTNTLTITSAFTTPPAKWDVYSFGEVTKVAKPFSVIDITRSQDMRRKLSAIEYVEAVYTESDTVPEINYSALESDAYVTSIVVNQETYRQRDGTIVSNLYPSWRISRGKRPKVYAVSYRKESTTEWIRLPDASEQKTIVSNVRSKESYEVRVAAINDVGVVSAWLLSAPVYVTGKDNPPSDVTGLVVIRDPQDSTKIIITTDPVTDIDFKALQITINGSVLPLVYGFSYTHSISTSGSYNVSVVAVDWSENVSLNPATSYLSVEINPMSMRNFRAVQNGSNVILVWDDSGELDKTGYEIREGITFENSNLIVTGVTGLSYSVPVSDNRRYRYHIKAINRAGYYSLVSSNAEINVTNIPDKNIIYSYDEIDLQTGTHESTAFGENPNNCLTLTGNCNDAEYAAVTCDQIGGIIVINMLKSDQHQGFVLPHMSIGDLYPQIGRYTTARKDMGKIITANISCKIYSNNLQNVYVLSTVKVRTSTDGTNFTPWKNLVPYKETFRYVDFMIEMESYDLTKSPIVSQFVTQIDADDVLKAGTTVVDVGGTYIGYGHEYFLTPSFVPTAIGAGLYAEYTDVGKTSTQVIVRRISDNVDVGGKISWLVKGA